MDSSDIVAIFIFRSDGSELYAEVFDESVTHHHLMSQFLAGVNLFSKEITGESVDGMILGNNFFVFTEIISEIMFVILCNNNLRPDILLLLISRRFIKEYSQLLSNWDGEVTKFESFSLILKEMITKPRHEVILVVPQNPLDSIALLEFDKESHDVIKYIMNHGEVFEEDLETNFPVSKVHSILSSLIQKGYIGKKLRNNEISYYKL